jgi:hypothetical protein
MAARSFTPNPLPFRTEAGVCTFFSGDPAGVDNGVSLCATGFDFSGDGCGGCDVSDGEAAEGLLATRLERALRDARSLAPLPSPPEEGEDCRGAGLGSGGGASTLRRIASDAIEDTRKFFTVSKELPPLTRLLSNEANKLRS